MTDMVIDASLALAWCFKDELTEAATRLLEELRSSVATVPSLWSIEVANVLALAERRKRITFAESAQLIALLGTLQIDVDRETSALAFTRLLDLAREERLTAYDAAYLELAMRLGVPLASKDRDLCDAAERVGLVAIRAGGD
jgi:predicted nucleic acid-binding protein